MTTELKALGQRIWEQDDVSALDELEPLVQATPALAPGHRLLFNGALKFGQPTRAGRALTRFETHHPDNPDLPRMRMHLDHLQARATEAEKQANAALSKGDLQSALSLFETAGAADSTDPGLLNVYAAALKNAGESDRLAALLTDAEALAEDSGAARHSLLAGNVASHLNRPDQAADWYRRAVKQDPLQVPGWQRLADLAMQAGRPEEAIDLLESLPERHQTNMALTLLRVRALEQAGQGMAARRMLMAQPQSTQGIAWHVNLARLARDGFDQGGVIEACSAALCADPNQPETLELRAMARALRCDPEGSWNDAQAANAVRRARGNAMRLRPRQGIVGGLANEMRLDPEATGRLRAALASADPATRLAAEIHASNQLGHAQTVAGLALLGAMRRQELAGLNRLKPSETEPEIPAQIWIYHEQGARDKMAAQSLEKLRAAAPWAEVTLLDLRSALALLRKEAPEHAVRAWRLCRQAGEREDLLRLALMATLGGIWLSLKTQLRGDLHDLLAPGADLVLAQDTTGAPASGFVAAAPKQALMQAILADVSGEMIAGASEFVWLRTGPGAMARGLAAAIADQAGKTGPAALPPGVSLLSPTRARTVLSGLG